MRDTKLILTAVLAIILASSAFAENRQTNDSLESLNRKAFVFNETLDKKLLKPVAKIYTAVVPDPLEKGILNVFGNLNEVTNILNDLLQA